jgi:hypothetical protein
MNGNARMAELAALAGMVRDLRLQDVASASAAHAASLARLADLAPVAAEGLEPLSEARIALRYEVWADRRRQEINAVLANQVTALEAARANARTAFGRAQALLRLAGKA